MTTARQPVATPFTLIEVLVAVVICGVLLVVILAAFSQNLQGAGLAEDYSTAALLARGRLAELTVARDLAAGVTSGDFGHDFPRFRWQQTLTATSNGQAFRVELLVRWQRDELPRDIRLHSYLPAPAALVVPDLPDRDREQQ